ISEGATDVTVNLSDLDDSAGVAANAANIATNTTNIATNTTNIATNTTDIATNATDIANHIAADGDLSATNEIQDLDAVLTEGNDAGGSAIVNLADPTNAQDAATKNYVDGIADDDITGAVLDAPTNVLTISEGATDVTVDLSDLDDSAGVTANAANIATNTTNIATNTTDIATNATNIATNATNIATNTTNIATNTTNIATNTTNIATNTTDIATNATNIATNTTDIGTNATDIANHIAADGDLSATNEIQDLDAVLAEGNDAGGSAITNLADPTNAQDAATKNYVDGIADDDITGAALDAPTNVLTISEGATDVTVDLSDLDDSAGVAANAANIATNTTNIATNTANIGTNTVNIATNTTNIATNATDIANHIAADGDLSATNEIQDLDEVLAEGNDAGGSAITNLADPTNAQDAATKNYVDGIADDDITGAALDAPTNVLTISEGATDVTVDLSDLDDSAGVSANAANIATNTTNIATNTANIGTNTTNIATNTTDIATNATDIANHIAADGDLSATNEIQDLDAVLTEGNDAGGASITNLADPTNAQDAATKNYV
ncbi:hypothetical protein, partial [Flagellimonas allohymeniacidonis]|uniref:hypothetical protein n=1 Tax=Flagellimonas allohymeniacidonis TaxID=2517819 RepID=UPI00197B7197